MDGRRTYHVEQGYLVGVKAIIGKGCRDERVTTMSLKSLHQVSESKVVYDGLCV